MDDSNDAGRWQPGDPSTIIIPGLDINAPANDQIEQIEQLITLKLQQVDENVSRIKNTLSTRLLPAVKRFAMGTEPVRETAKFWTSFYEAAAQVRIPIDASFASFSEKEDGQDLSNKMSQSSEEQSGTSLSSETSFLPGQAAISSTPAPIVGRYPIVHEDSDSSAWITSDDTPLDRLSKDIRQIDIGGTSAGSRAGIGNMNYHEGSSHRVGSSSNYSESSSSRIPSTAQSGSSYSRFLQNPLGTDSSAAYTTTDDSFRSDHNSMAATPTPRRPVTHRHNPYLPPGTRTKDWSGVIDLQTAPLPSVASPSRSRLEYSTENDEDVDDLPPGMSPPVTMRFNFPMRATGADALSRISSDLVERSFAANGGSTTSAIMSPMRRRAQSRADKSQLSLSNDSPTKVPSQATDIRYADEDDFDDSMTIHQAPPLMSRPQFSGQDDEFSDSDPEDENPRPLNFHNPALVDDSFGSQDSFGEEEGPAPLQPPQFFQTATTLGDDSFEDSFDAVPNAETETLFGVDRRMPLHQHPTDFRLHGQRNASLENTIGYGQQMTRAGALPNSPTPQGFQR